MLNIGKLKNILIILNFKKIIEYFIEKITKTTKLSIRSFVTSWFN